MVAIPYNLLERVRLLVTRRGGEILGEDFGYYVAPDSVDAFDGFQNELRELSAGKLKAEVIESKETIAKIA
jgi:hypothetical protein